MNDTLVGVRAVKPIMLLVRLGQGVGMWMAGQAQS